MNIQQKFKQALKSGTGKAYFILKEHPEIDFSKIIKKSLLKRECNDGQCEGIRGAYYYNLIQVSKKKKGLVKFVLKELQKDQDDWYILAQLYEVAALVGVNEGNGEAIQGIRKRFRKELEETEDYDGEKAMLRIDGERAFLILTRIRGVLLKQNPDWSEWGGLITQFNKFYPKLNGNKILKRASLGNVFIKEYWDRVQESKVSSKRNIKVRKTKYTYKNITKRINAKPFFWVSGNVKVDENTLYKLALDLQKETKTKKQERYLRVFAKYKFPLGTEFLFNLIKQKNQSSKKLIKPAIKALVLFQSNEIRTYALSKLKKKKDILIHLPLLIRNYQAEDDVLLSELLEMKWTRDEIHELNYTYGAIFRENEVKECFLPLKQLYNKLNCGICRESVLKTMLDNKVLTSDILKEMKFDSHVSVRKLYKKVK